MHGCLCSPVSKTRLRALLPPRPRMKHSPGPDKINSSLGQISSFPAFFSSARLFVSNAVIDVWPGDGGYGERHKPQHLTNVQSTIELSFIFQATAASTFQRFSLWEGVMSRTPPFLKMWNNFFFFFFLKMAYICAFPIPAFIIPDELI